MSWRSQFSQQCCNIREVSGLAGTGEASVQVEGIKLCLFRTSQEMDWREDSVRNSQDGLNCALPTPNLYVKPYPPDVTVFGDRAMTGVLVRRGRDTNDVRAQRDIAKRQLSASQAKAPGGATPANTLILDLKPPDL